MLVFFWIFMMILLYIYGGSFGICLNKDDRFLINGWKDGEDLK